MFVLLIILVCGHASIVHAACWNEAAAMYDVDPILLKAIGWHESRGWSGAKGPILPDGNRAIGVMQINTVHLPTLTRVGIRREDLLDACTSEKVGAWVLANCISQFGPTWKAVGCYNTGPASNNVAAQLRYVRSVQRYYAAYQRDAAREQQK
ncbi:lytic transglycosylase domain-containing protein [Burkholderia stagnalis]|uniref:lytic transglycosylase domain-containing protein n=1 Tax=Burkholderia stagnalis TaxID=1503054 RepID=UPI000753A826|nr:lytic transglycosylase domain-containing protein [Burkholderia stagnalis]KVL85329.1 lytic transglycosylase [Burkholderia stagnalis]KVL91976.1 lytic transglycosylase [Burkholderia stagnalis]KVM06115.1 lytic transglycosylase [Burkholderia stagnalis]